MRPILTVTSAASDVLLLTEAEARQATGVETGQETKIQQLRRAVSAAIVSRCNVWADGATAPTLRLETLSQQFRLECPVDEIRLVRRPVISVTSVIEDGVTLETTDYELNPSTGMLLRLCSDYPSWWAPAKITVVYTAGWNSVPENMRSAAMRLANAVWARATRGDPSLKRIEIPDVITKEFWVAPSDDPLFSRDMEELLADYINPLQA